MGGRGTVGLKKEFPKSPWQAPEVTLDDGRVLNLDAEDPKCRIV